MSDSKSGTSSGSSAFVSSGTGAADPRVTSGGAVVSSGTVASAPIGSSGGIASLPTAPVPPSKPVVAVPVVPPLPKPVAFDPEPRPSVHLRLESGHIHELMQHIKAWLAWDARRNPPAP